MGQDVSQTEKGYEFFIDYGYVFFYHNTKKNINLSHHLKCFSAGQSNLN